MCAGRGQDQQLTLLRGTLQSGLDTWRRGGLPTACWVNTRGKKWGRRVLWAEGTHTGQRGVEPSQGPQSSVCTVAVAGAWRQGHGGGAGAPWRLTGAEDSHASS